ncbi:MAG: putative glycoside hydrolase [Candidatus Binatia bacterium]
MELFPYPNREQPVRSLGKFHSSPKPQLTSEGRVRMYGVANTEFAPYLVMEDWIIDHYERMQVYAPWFDEHTAWYVNGLEYKDLYAIYNCAQLFCDQESQAMYDRAMQAEADPDLPDWILKDSQGNPLYIPWGCESGTCPQLATDISNSTFRTSWIEQMTSALRGGNYRGLFVDDVNLDLNRAVSDGNQCTLISENCDWTVDINEADWAGFVADFTAEIRAAFPDCEIVHNSVWYHAQPGNLYLQRQVDAADHIALERGINDPGMQPGWGTFGIESFLDFNDYLHGRGRNVVHFIHINALAHKEAFDPGEPVFTQPLFPLKQIEYGLAGWLLVSNGHDLFGADEFNTPYDWWHGFDIDLGLALGERYQDLNGLLRRDFEYGIVLLNGPGTSFPVTVTLSETFYTLEGDPVDEITLEARVGKILLREPLKFDSFVIP